MTIDLCRDNFTKQAFVPASHHEGEHTIEGTSYLLKSRRYIHCTQFMSHSERVTCFWSIFPCHPCGMTDSDISTRPTSRIYLESDTSPKSPSPITISASVVNMASRLQPHTGRHHQENWIHSIWSIQMRVAQRYVTLLVASPISSASLTTQLGKCGHTRPEPKVGCSRSSRNGSPWWRTSLTVLQKLKCLRSDNGGEYK